MYYGLVKANHKKESEVITVHHANMADIYAAYREYKNTINY